MRDVRRSGRWFPERGCILEHQICRFAKMILRDRCSTSYDLAFPQTMAGVGHWKRILQRCISHSTRSMFIRDVRRSGRSQTEWKNCKTHWYEAVSSEFTFHYWRKSRRVASFLMLSTWNIEEVSQNSFVFDSILSSQELRKSRRIAAFFPTSLCGVLVFGWALPRCLLPPPPPPPPPPTCSHTTCPHTTYAHTTYSHTTYSHTTPPPPACSHTHNLSTHTTYAHTHNLLTHTTYSHTHNLHTTCPHTTNAHTHTTYSHTTYSHTTHTHNLSTHTTYSHTTCSHTTCPHTTYSHTTYSHNLFTQLVHTQLLTQLPHTHTTPSHTT